MAELQASADYLDCANFAPKRCGIAEAGCEEPPRTGRNQQKNSKKVGFGPMVGALAVTCELALGITNQDFARTFGKSRDPRAFG